MIEVRHLKKAYPNATPLKDVNAVINSGDVISVIGPSGCGKSTLLRCVNMLETPTSGEVYIDGECISDPNCDIDKLRAKIGMVFQSFNLFNHLMVIENLMNPQVDVLGRSRQEAYDKSMKLLRTVGLADRALRYPDELSGGQKQRVAIARALAMDPEIILFDEPTSALDPNMTGEVKSVIRDMASQGRTMMIVTHEMEFARSICNRVFYMDEGCIYEDGTPEQIFEDPQKEKTRQFIYRLSTLEFDVTSRNYDFKKSVSDIDAFGRKHELSPKRIYRLQSVFEEICVVNLLNRFGKSKMRVNIQYVKKTDDLILSVKYESDDTNVHDSFDPMSLSIINALSDSGDAAALTDDPLGYNVRFTANFKERAAL